VGVYTERILEAEPSVHYYSLEPQPYLEFYLNVLFRNYSVYSIQGSGADIPTIKNSELDLVLAYNVFTYLKITVVLKYLREISRVLKPSGKAVLHFFEVDSISPNGLEELESFTNNFDNRLILSASFLKNYARRWNLELISEYRLSPGSISTWLVFEKL
jgi:SAM-dependent methyltransferase